MTNLDNKIKSNGSNNFEILSAVCDAVLDTIRTKCPRDYGRQPIDWWNYRVANMVGSSSTHGNTAAQLYRHSMINIRREWNLRGLG